MYKLPEKFYGSLHVFSISALRVRINFRKKYFGITNVIMFKQILNNFFYLFKTASPYQKLLFVFRS